MSPYIPKGRTIWLLHVPTRHGGWVIRTTGTRHKPTAQKMQRMIDALGPKGSRDWELLDAVSVSPPRLTLGGLYDAWSRNGLDELRGRLDDLDLRPVYDAWMRHLHDNRAANTATIYQSRMRTLVPAEDADGVPLPWPRSTLTSAAIRAWIDAAPGTAANKVGYMTAVQSFGKFARTIGALKHDPTSGVVRPRAAKRSIRFLELPDVQRVVDGADRIYRVLFAILHACGMEISVAVQLTARDFDQQNRSVRMRGKKTDTRDRQGIVAEWAWPIISAHLRTLLPDAPLFPGINRTRAGEHWREITRALKLRADASGRGGVTMHDARHHWAVRMLRAGTPVEIVSGQLGHASTKMTLDTYGPFVPDHAELRKWEAQAVAMDAMRFGTGA